MSQGMAIKLGGQTPIEREAVRARLDALGVAVGKDGQVDAPDFAKAKISLEDLARVAPSGTVDLAQLDGLVHHQRRLLGVPMGKVAVELAGTAEAKAVVESHRAQLELATGKLGALALEGGPLTEGGKLGSLASLLENVAAGVGRVRSPETLARVSAAELTSVGLAHAQLLDGYADLAQAIQRDAFELSRSKGQMASVSSIFTSLATLADALPAFDARPEVPAASVGAQAATVATERLGALTDTHAVLDAYFGASKLEKSPALEQAVTPIFDRAAFRGLPEENKTKWVAALATLPADEITALAGPLAGLLANPAIAALPPARLEKVVDQLTALPPSEHAGRVAQLEVARKGGKLSGAPEVVDAALAEALRGKPGAPTGKLDAALAQRTDAALTTVAQHLGRPTPKATFSIPGEPRLRLIDAQLGKLMTAASAAEKKRTTDQAAIEKKAGAAIDALPGIAGYRAIAEQVGDLEKKQKFSADRLDKAEYIMRDWERTKERDKWKLNYGAPIGMAYYDDKETAEVVAPRVRREESRNLGKLDAQLEALAPQIAEMKAFHAQHIAPIEADKAAALKAESSAYYDAYGARNTEIHELRQEGRTLLRSATQAAGESWVFDSTHLSHHYKNKPFDEQFKPKYSETRRNVTEFQRVMTEQRAAVAEPLGLFAVDARKRRDDNLGHLTTNVERLENIVAGGALDQGIDREVQQRAAWNRTTEWLNRLLP